MNNLFQVELSGIIKILSDHLYSQPTVFIREVLQNATDAIIAREIRESFKPKIYISYFENDQGAGFIITDNGIGLTEPQIEQFLAKIGSSSKSLESLNDTRSDFIGQFGIGILSCFMVSDAITVITRSVDSDTTFKWTGRVDGTYLIEKADHPLEQGTRIILTLRSDIEHTTNDIRDSVLKFGKHLSVPIELEINGENEGTINQVFPWEISGVNDDVLANGIELFGESFQHYIPLINPKDGSQQGVLYIMPRPSAQVREISGFLYVKRMFVSNRCDDLLPNWAVFVKPIINTDQLSLNASRESIYLNDDAKNLKEHIASSIKLYLKKLSQEYPKLLQHILQVHNSALKQIAIHDSDFLFFIYKWFEFQTSQGMMTLDEIRGKYQTIFHIPNIDEFRQIVPIANANQKLVLNTGFAYDAALIKAIERIDVEHDYIKIDARYFGDFLGELDLNEDKVYRSRIIELQQYLNAFDCQIKLKKFDPKNVSAIFHASINTMQFRDVKNIREESNSLWKSIGDNVATPKDEIPSKLYLNANNNLVLDLLKESSNNEKAIIETLLVSSMMMGHYPLTQRELNSLNDNLSQFLNLAIT